MSAHQGWADEPTRAHVCFTGEQGALYSIQEWKKARKLRNLTPRSPSADRPTSLLRCTSPETSEASFVDPMAGGAAASLSGSSKWSLYVLVKDLLEPRCRCLVGARELCVATEEHPKHETDRWPASSEQEEASMPGTGRAGL